MQITISKSEIINQYRNTCDKEYEMTKKAICNKLFNPKDVINNSIQRCLGVALFIQYLGVTYDDIDKFFEEFKYKINNLRVDN